MTDELSVLVLYVLKSVLCSEIEMSELKVVFVRVMQGVLCVQREVTIVCLLHIALQQKASIPVKITLISIMLA